MEKIRSLLEYYSFFTFPTFIVVIFSILLCFWYIETLLFHGVRSVIYRIAIFTTRVIWQRIHVYVAVTADNLLSIWHHLPLYGLFDTDRLRSDDPGLSDRRFTSWYQKRSFRLGSTFPIASLRGRRVSKKIRLPIWFVLVRGMSFLFFLDTKFL